MNDILFGNNNSKVITKLSKRYFKKNKVRNLAALLAIILTAFLFTSITSLAFNMASSIQLSLQMQKGSKADGTLGYMTEEQYEQLVNSDFVEQAGHRRIIGYASNTSSHSIEINYADSVQQELTFCVPTHGAAPEKANEIATTDLALKALGVEPEIGAEVPLEFELRGKTYHYQLQVGESISFYKDGELVKTSTILAKAILVGTETETPTATTAQTHIAGDAPFVYLPDTVFKEIYDAPTLLTYGFNVDEALQPQMEEFLSSYVSENSSVAYTSTKLLKEQLDSVRSMILVIGGLIGCIMAFAGLINFTNMIITNIITRRHEFATMQSIGMTGKQLRRLTVYEGIYYAVGADIIGGAVAAILAVTVLKSALNGPSMWFFTLNITLVPVLVIGVLYLLLAAVIPLIVLHFFNKGTVVERLRTSE